jgi:hypothetical protein
MTPGEVKARLASLGEFGWYGNAEVHLKYIEPFSTRRRCRHDDCTHRTTHLGRANGVTLTSGCEWHMRQWLHRPARVGPGPADQGDLPPETQR